MHKSSWGGVYRALTPIPERGGPNLKSWRTRPLDAPFDRARLRDHGDIYPPVGRQLVRALEASKVQNTDEWTAFGGGFSLYISLIQALVH